MFGQKIIVNPLLGVPERDCNFRYVEKPQAFMVGGTLVVSTLWHAKFMRDHIAEMDNAPSWAKPS